MRPLIGMTRPVTLVPEPLDSAITEISSTGTTHAINIPEVKASNHVQVLIQSNVELVHTLSPPDGTWTEVFNVALNFHKFACYVKAIDSDSAATTTDFTTSESASVTAIAHRIVNFFGDVSTDVSSTLTSVTSSASPDAPNESPSWGSSNALWFSLWGWQGETSVSAYPSGYSGGTEAVTSGATNGGCGVGTSWLQKEAASEDPGAGTLNTSSFWRAATLVYMGV